jgi:hypothetical protein
MLYLAAHNCELIVDSFDLSSTPQFGVLDS